MHACDRLDPGRGIHQHLTGFPILRRPHLERELTRHMTASGYPFHAPLYSLLFASGDFLPEVRLTPAGLVEVKSGTVLAPARPLVGSRG